MIGAAREVHRELGQWVFGEGVQEEMEIECSDQGIPLLPQCELPIFYKGRQSKSGTLPTSVCSRAESSWSLRPSIA